jgi:hypothetical protein
MIARIRSNIMHRTTLIHSGENTHNHDHAINPASFAITKMIVIHPAIPSSLILALVCIYLFLEISKPPPLNEDPVFYAESRQRGGNF